MLTVSLHGIKIQSAYGLFPEEQILGNEFEVDVDISVTTGNDGAWPFVDYTVIREITTSAFEEQGKLLETLVHRISELLKERFENIVKIKVTVRKLHPPMPGEVKYAQVCFES